MVAHKKKEYVPLQLHDCQGRDHLVRAAPRQLRVGRAGEGLARGHVQHSPRREDRLDGGDRQSAWGKAILSTGVVEISVLVSFPVLFVANFTADKIFYTMYFSNFKETTDLLRAMVFVRLLRDVFFIKMSTKVS